MAEGLSFLCNIFDLTIMNEVLYILKVNNIKFNNRWLDHNLIVPSSPHSGKILSVE